MTLDEAIKHCDEVIEKEDCSKCAKEHEQLKEWLEELKELKNPQPYKFEELYKNMYVWVRWFKEDPTKGRPVRITGTGYDDNNNRVVYYQYGDGVGAYDFDAFVFYPLTMALKIPKPIKLTQFEYDLLNAYSYEGTNVPNSRLIDYDFLND